MKTFSFEKKERIRTKKDFNEIFKKGKVFKSKNFVLLIKKNNLDYSRIGIIVKKKVGNAVKRNRFKRLIREVFRLNKNNFKTFMDIVFIVKIGIKINTFSECEQEILSLLDTYFNTIHC